MAPSFMSRLKAEIADLHDEAEKRGPLSAIARGDFGVEEYRAALAQLYGIAVPMEEALAGSLAGQESQQLRYPARRRAAHLMADLAFLGLSQADIASLPRYAGFLPDMPLPLALGLLYLLEGFRFGDQVLSMSVRDRLGFGPGNGCDYLSSAGAEVGPLWTSLQEFVEGYVERNGEGEGEVIIFAARAGFEAVNDWLAGRS